jgi:hypothetical protein
MTVTLALDLCRKIDETIQADQGASYRGWLGRVLPHMSDAYRDNEETHRSHIGASQLGKDCGRAVFYDFHWTTKAAFNGRMLRLFNRGHIEEARFIAMLLMVGMPVYQQTPQGEQFHIEFGDGHGGGSGDGVTVYNENHCLIECKTHNEKSFIELAGSLETWRAHLAEPAKNPFKGKGVRGAKPDHFVQAQIYMRRMGLAFCLYMAVNKNTDDLYIEIVTLNPEHADQYIDRGIKLINLREPPPKISSSPGFWKCIYCDHKPVCHMKRPPDRNCRTCKYSQVASQGQWRCTHPTEASILTKEKQLVGCPFYKMAEYYL